MMHVLHYHKTPQLQLSGLKQKKKKKVALCKKNATSKKRKGSDLNVCVC